jgi:PadR family transcriptional regulator, regulatory protein PadR
MGTKQFSMTELKVMRAFLDDPAGEHYGLEISRRSEVKSGSLYPALAKLEADGVVTSSWEDIDESEAGRRRRRYYRLTATGVHTAANALTEASNALAPPSGLLPGLV